MDRSLDDIIDGLSGESDRDQRERGPRLSRPRSRSPIGRRPTDSGEKGSKRVYVYNLHYGVTWQDLKSTFKKAGPVTRADIMESRDGGSKGCGVVEFVDEESAVKAIQMFDRMKLMGREIGVREDRTHDIGFRRRSPPGPSRRPHTNIPACTVFVSNLDFSVGWQKVKDVFKVAGRVLNVEILTDRDNRSKGVATVQFEDPSMALNAISLFHGQMLMDRPMIVKMDRKAGPAPDSLSLRLSRLQEPPPQTLLGGSLLPSLHDLPLRDDRSNFKFDRERRDYLERLDQLSMSRKDRAMQYLSHRASQEAHQSRSNSSVGNSYSILGPPPASEPLFRSGSSKAGRQLFVNNLAYKTTWQILKDHFKKVGPVLHADILTNSEGKSRGSGLVLFSTSGDASRAVEVLNQSELDGRIIEVKFDQYA